MCFLVLCLLSIILLSASFTTLSDSVNSNIIREDLHATPQKFVQSAMYIQVIEKYIICQMVLSCTTIAGVSPHAENCMYKKKIGMRSFTSTVQYLWTALKGVDNLFPTATRFGA
jgi:hypothetical protein